MSDRQKLYQVANKVNAIATSRVSGTMKWPLCRSELISYYTRSLLHSPRSSPLLHSSPPLFPAPALHLLSSSLDLWDQDSFYNGHLSPNFKPSYSFITGDLHWHFSATSAISLHIDRASTQALLFLQSMILISTYSMCRTNVSKN